MKRTLIVGNWKGNKTAGEAKTWLENLSSALKLKSFLPFEVVLCPPYPLLPCLKEDLGGYSWPFLFNLGAQDVSQFEKGAYTGEVSAALVSDFASYVILGHSERRRFFREGSFEIKHKLYWCLKSSLTPILCVAGVKELKANLEDLKGMPNFVVVYEPPEAISKRGRLHPQKTEAVAASALKLRKLLGSAPRLLYGGSVSAGTVGAFLQQKNIDGVLVGAVSLDAAQFADLILAAKI